MTLTGKNAGSFVIQVSDQDTGVVADLADLADRVFGHRFSGSRGTGIGLPLARSLASAENGLLELVGGEGNTWQFTLLRP